MSAKLSQIGPAEETKLCPMSQEWQDVRYKVTEIHSAVMKQTAYLSHLEKLDALADIKTHLLGAATGRDHIPTKVAVTVIKILGLVIVALLAVILFLLTGEHFGLLGALHR